MELRGQINGIHNEINGLSLESMEPAPAKRRRQFPGHSKEGVFDKLPDDLIEEILLRLPLCSVFQSRCVSKGWLSITTSPFFVTLFERRRNPSEEDHSVGLLLQDPLSSNKKRLIVCSGAPEFNCSGFSLDFLPRLRTRLVGSCDNLLLCCNKPWCPSDYFIVNCVTREWVTLPPTLRLCQRVLIGFVCDPTSIPEAKKGANLRYRVVRIPISEKPETELNVEIFSSEDGQWNEYAMTCASGRETNVWCTSAVACNGSLYWKFMYHEEKIMAMDPFNPGKKELVVIQNPPDSCDIDLKTEHLGIHRGKLRMSRMILSDDELNEPSRLHIWELEEGNGGTKWRSVEEASLRTIVAANSYYEQLIRSSDGRRRWYWITLAIHPIYSDIIYFGCTLLNKIISCNLKTSCLEIVCDYRLNRWYYNHGAAFLIVLPWWPTPIPALPKL